MSVLADMLIVFLSFAGIKGERFTEYIVQSYYGV